VAATIIAAATTILVSEVTAVSGLSFYFSAAAAMAVVMVSLAAEAAAITAIAAVIG